MSAKVRQAVAEGRGGAFIPTEETRRKMSEALKGNQCALGYKRTDAERVAIRQRMLGNKNFFGKVHSEATKNKTRRPIYAILPDGTRREFPGVKLAGEELGVAYTMIVRLMTAKKRVAYGKLAGWFFGYADEQVEAPVIEIPAEFAHLPRTRQLAKEQGSPLYFTGVPCSHGHVAPRKTKGTCTACLAPPADKRTKKSANSKEMWRANGEKVAAGIKRGRSTEASKAKTSAQAKAQWGDPEYAAKQSANNREIANREDVKAAKRAAVKAMWDDPERRAKMMEARRHKKLAAQAAP
jgi:hypothetical protein